MLSELHENVVGHGVEVLLLVSAFLLAISKSLLILKELYILVGMSKA